MVAVVHTKLLPGWVEVPLSLLNETDSVSLLLTTGEVEVVSEDAVAAAKKIAKAANYLRTCNLSTKHTRLIFLHSSLVSIDPWWSHRPGD